MSLVDAAERSTLGALLHTPDSVGEVTCWLQPGDFLRPRNSIAFELIGGLASASRLGPLELLNAARDREEARRNRVDGPFVHDLLRSPASVDRPAVYGRLVLEASVRRQVLRHGLRLDQIDRASVVDGMAWTLAQVDRADEGLEALSRRLRRAGLPDAGVVSALRQDRLQVGSDRCHRQEAAVLSALIARPSAIEEVGLLLRPDDFRSPKHAATYASMQALADRSEPIEPLTVAWHARRRCRSLTLAELRALASRPVLGTARAACRALLELRLGEDIAAASTAMVHTSMRLDLSGSEVVALSRTHLAELAGLRARLGATDRYTSTGGRSRATAGQGESPAPERSR